MWSERSVKIMMHAEADVFREVLKFQVDGKSGDRRKVGAEAEVG